MLEKKELEFLDHSNRIEREYSPEALEDAIKAWEYAKKNMDSVSLKYILKIHKLLMKRLRPDIAGKVRECAVMIGGEIKEKVNIYVLEFALTEWLDDFDNLCTAEHWQRAHVVFEKIHPFEDGNGRVGRILMNINLLKAGKPIKIIHEGKEQHAYYKWFNK